MPIPEPSLTHIPDIHIALREVYDREPYDWDNAIRETDGGIVIQRTLSGSVSFTPKNKNLPTTEVGKAQAMLFKHGENSRYGLGPISQRPYVAEFVVFDGAGGAEELFDGIRSRHGEVLPMADQGEAALILQRLAADFHEKQVPDRLSLAGILYRLLLAMQREQMQETLGNDPVAYGRHLLETQFRSPRNLKEWCEEIGLSREHFSRCFKDRYGQGPAEFLRHSRLKHAQTLLKTSHMPLEDIAASSGFASVQTFHRAYKRAFGKSARSP
ncbi:MAG: helix-turn-helix transcriptional regulator [Verrucomicrobia bacterium]|nr:helix-turn-helix transcriptional regulator [Verrucomicrobiota bacterium]MCH8510840.1 helix-turn-helix transcriptional regulator [Kiritimatiellia bacterium]